MGMYDLVKPNKIEKDCKIKIKRLDKLCRAYFGTEAAGLRGR